MEAQHAAAPLHKLAGKEPHIFALTVLCSFASMGAILMTPALPAIAAYFEITAGKSQLTVSAFLFGYAIGQIIYGPIANRFGRKPAFYIGIAIATLGSLLSTLASPIYSFYLLIFGRFLEALGASAGLVVCFTLVNDFYYPKEAKRVISMMMVAFAIIPGIAVFIGGTLTEYLYWQTCFYFLLFYGLALLYAVYTIPETILNYDKTALNYKKLITNYKKLFLHKKFMGYSLCTGFSTACIYLFSAEGPFIGIHLLHISPGTYGILGLTPYIGTLLGTMINVHYGFVNASRMIKIGFSIECIAAIMMLLFFITDHVTMLTLLLPMGLFCIGYSILAANAISLAMIQTNDFANASAMRNFVMMSMCVLMTFILSILHLNVAWMLPVMFIAALMFMVVNYFILIGK